MEIINQKQPLPNSAATLVLGILSIVIGCGILGLVLGIIGLVISKDSKTLYFQYPDKYTGYNNLNAGRVMCIIGIVLGGVTIAIVLSVFSIVGAIISSLIGWGGMQI
jgi:hypothetical protein